MRSRFPKLNPALPVHSASAFTWSRLARRATAEASDLGPNRRFTAPLFADRAGANDAGFFIHSPRTGVERLFVFTHAERDAEGDIVAWHFQDYNQAQSPFVVTVLND